MTATFTRKQDSHFLMQNLRFPWLASRVTLLVASCFSAMAFPQHPPSTPQTGSNNDWLAQATKMYYSSTTAGLKGFDCEVRPDWQALYAAKNGGQVSALDQPKLTLLNAVKIALHARMENGSIVDWNPPNEKLDAGQTELLKTMQSAMNQMLQGFVQLWSPFIERQLIPDSPNGLDIVTTENGGRKIHGIHEGLEVSEDFDSGRILRRVVLATNGTKVDTTPTFSSTDHGLVVTHLQQYISHADDPEKTQELNVEITYQWIESFPVPAHLDMDVAKIGNFQFAFENCTAQH